MKSKTETPWNGVHKNMNGNSSLFEHQAVLVVKKENRKPTEVGNRFQ